MERSKVQLLTRDIASIGVVGRMVTSELMSQMTLTAFGFIGSGRLDTRHISTSAKPTYPLFVITTHHTTVMPL